MSLQLLPTSEDSWNETKLDRVSSASRGHAATLAAAENPADTPVERALVKALAYRYPPTRPTGNGYAETNGTPTRYARYTAHNQSILLLPAVHNKRWLK